MSASPVTIYLSGSSPPSGLSIIFAVFVAVGSIRHAPRFDVDDHKALFYAFTVLIYRIYFHPLSRFPGPLLARVSNVYFSYIFLGDSHTWDMLALHERYGSVIRIAPNELAFSSAQSWRDIYGGRQPFIKSPFFEGTSFAGKAQSIITVRDPKEHQRMHRYLSAAFSERSLKDQESLIASVIDQFIEKIGEPCRNPIDITRWFHLMSFDVIGELSFGRSFGGLEKGELHPWVRVVMAFMDQMMLGDTLTRFPIIGKMLMKIFSGKVSQLMEDMREHESFAMEAVHA